MSVKSTHMLTINSTVPLTKAQKKATYRCLETPRNNKPVFIIPAGSILKFKSAFAEKKLCDGPTLSLGMACHARCSFCYVPSQLGRHPAILKIIKQTGLGFDQIVIEKEDPLPLLRGQLFKGTQPKFSDPRDQRVVFSSPLVDVAANRHTAKQTVEACKIILENTNWQIRLLSKFALLAEIAVELAGYRERIIYGFSTGTLDDKVAACMEKGTSSPTARLRALHSLQDEGYRTFAMLCPTLPQQDYAAFAAEATRRVRHDICEHVWAEVFNLRGRSLTKSCVALKSGGCDAEAARLESVSGKDHKVAWETYARRTFLALAAIVPAEKLRFLQYVQNGRTTWWQKQERRGAVLLGKFARSKTIVP